MAENHEVESGFEKFLLAEYDNIAQAHFNMVSTISSFFQYYILILSAVVVLGKVGDWYRYRDDIAKLLTHNSVSVGVTSLAVFLALLGVAGYIINLRSDALLYARTVNGIRKFFMNRAEEIHLSDEFRIRVLPRSTFFPRYLEPGYFDCVVLTFGLLNSLVLCFGWWPFVSKGNYSMLWVLAIGLVGLSLHDLAYRLIAHHRESSYIGRHTIGVDIDGVLGRHREQFCSVLSEIQGKVVKPNEIIRIPVHECSDLDVTEIDEIAVFHEPRYWSDMPVDENATYVLKRLQDLLHYRVFIFSWRDWPNENKVAKNQRPAFYKAWREAAIKSTYRTAEDLPIHIRWKRFRQRIFFWRPIRLLLCWPFSSITTYWPFCRAVKCWPIRKITRDWLWRHGINYDSLMIEYGNTDSPDRTGNVRNRFITCQDQGIRIFVEDDMNKARRLADICDIVFLIKHPYNQTSSDDILQRNIVPVDGWKEIYDYIRYHL